MWRICISCISVYAHLNDTLPKVKKTYDLRRKCVCSVCVICFFSICTSQRDTTWYTLNICTYTMYIAEESPCSSFWYHVQKKQNYRIHPYIIIMRTSPAHHFPFPTTSSAPTEAALAGNLASLKKVDDLHTGQERRKVRFPPKHHGVFRKAQGKLKATLVEQRCFCVV